MKLSTSVVLLMTFVFDIRDAITDLTFAAIIFGEFSIYRDYVPKKYQYYFVFEDITHP